MIKLCMDKLVYLDHVENVGDFLEHAAWLGVDGVEVDITEMTEAEYTIAKNHLLDSNVQAKSIHYGRTNTVSLKEPELFHSQLDMLVERANQLNCDILSVHPPRVEKETANTMRDLQQFVKQVDEYAAAADLNISFELTGFMKDPQLINVAFADLDNPSIGVMVDLGALVDGVDPLSILQKVDVDIHKVRVPLSVKNMNEQVGELQEGMAVVATSLE